jgi:hypothetical protein
VPTGTRENLRGPGNFSHTPRSATPDATSGAGTWLALPGGPCRTCPSLAPRMQRSPGAIWKRCPSWPTRSTTRRSDDTHVDLTQPQPRRPRPPPVRHGRDQRAEQRADRRGPHGLQARPRPVAVPRPDQRRRGAPRPRRAQGVHAGPRPRPAARRRRRVPPPTPAAGPRGRRGRRAGRPRQQGADVHRPARVLRRPRAARSVVGVVLAAGADPRASGLLPADGSAGPLAAAPARAARPLRPRPRSTADADPQLSVEPDRPDLHARRARRARRGRPRAADDRHLRRDLRRAPPRRRAPVDRHPLPRGHHHQLRPQQVVRRRRLAPRHLPVPARAALAARRDDRRRQRDVHDDQRADPVRRRDRL